VLRSGEAEGSVNGSSTVQSGYDPGGAIWTARHGQGFNLGEVADGHGWPCPVSSVRVASGLPHRLVARPPVLAAPGSNASVVDAVGEANGRETTLTEMCGHQFSGELDYRVHITELYLLPPGVSRGGPQPGGSSGALGL